MKPVAVTFFKLKTGPKKMKAVFKMTNGDIKTVKFGAKGYSDFTLHKDRDRRRRYVLRHQKREDWNSPMTPGALSYHILWSYPDLDYAISRFKKKFKLK